MLRTQRSSGRNAAMEHTTLVIAVVFRDSMDVFPQVSHAGAGTSHIPGERGLGVILGKPLSVLSHDSAAVDSFTSALSVIPFTVTG